MNHIAKRAIIMAAGMGNRLLPITLHTPKPLILVNGKRIIDTILMGLNQNGIYEIYIVAGYLKEQFMILEKEYPGVRILENPMFRDTGSISSLYAAKEFLNTDLMILDGDQYINQPSVLNSSFVHSGYNCALMENAFEEWFLTIEDDVITHCETLGCGTGMELFSLSRWTKEDCDKLLKHLLLEFETHNNRSIWWDNLALTVFPEEYCLHARVMSPNAIYAIDTLEELAMLDSSYKQLVKGKKA